MAANEVTAIRIPAGVRGAPGAGISAAQWAALQAIVPSDTTGQIVAPNVTSQGQFVAGAVDGSSTHRLIGHLRLEGDATLPTINWGDAGGSAATITNQIGNDVAGHFGITIGTTPNGTVDHTVVEVTLRESFSNVSWCIHLFQRNSFAAEKISYVYAIPTAVNKWEIRLARSGALTAGVNYDWQYWVVQGAT